ncbi:hypothetical protein [Flavobacterium hiemivividum]|nr:hypothetical protein [Flavobacterium hiemivividum]
MKLSSLKTVEVLNSKSVELISGGLVEDSSKKKDIVSTSGDSYSDDK